MKFIMKMKMGSSEGGSEYLNDPNFGSKMKELLSDIKAEAAYFTTICGDRGAFIVVNMDDTSQMPALAEPFFLWLKAEIDWYPVMMPEDLAKAGPAIEAANKKWRK
jgi:hypothetical protein